MSSPEKPISNHSLPQGKHLSVSVTMDFPILETVYCWPSVSMDSACVDSIDHRPEISRKTIRSVWIFSHYSLDNVAQLFMCIYMVLDIVYKLGSIKSIWENMHTLCANPSFSVQIVYKHARIFCYGL